MSWHEGFAQVQKHGPLGAVIVALSAATTYAVISLSLSSLNSRMESLQTSLDSSKEHSEDRLGATRDKLDGKFDTLTLRLDENAREIANLSQAIRDLSNTLGRRLEENSTQVASLNSTIAGVNQRLTETIARQQAFESIYLRQRILMGPPPLVDEGKYKAIAADWDRAGVDVTPYFKANEADALKTWAEFFGKPQ